VAGIGQRLLDQVARQLTRRGLEALSREMELRLKLNVGAASATIAVGTSAIVDAEIVDAADADDATDDAAAANPESGDAPEAATALSGEADPPSSAAGASDGDGSPGPAAHPVEPLEETACADSPLPPGMDGTPAPVADLDAHLPPGTV
jgi:hypothetical protein